MSITLDLDAFFKRLARALRIACPDKTCQGKLRNTGMDGYTAIYTCDCCGKEWV
jgi:hypothetical protein